MSSQAFGETKIKGPNVSGQFYDADPKRLSANLDRFFQSAQVPVYDKHIDILIAPHAGYMFSGGVAAYSYKAVSGRPYKTVVILAPSHYVGFEGVSVWGEGGFETPLGVSLVDEDFAKQLVAANKNFYFLPQAFEREHSLEVQIPFLQKTFQDFKIVPVMFGQPDFGLLDKFASALNAAIGARKDVLVVVSTDLSHYHADAFAREMDARTIEALKDFDAERLWAECQAQTMEMCGCVPVTAALLYAREKGLKGMDVLRYAHSGDVSGDMERVVGYASVVIYGENGGQEDSVRAQNPQEGSSDASQANARLSQEQKKRLLDIARKTMEMYVRSGEIWEMKESDPRLSEIEGAFVTIHQNGELRGCIGNIIGNQPLYLTVRDMAIAAAVRDPRFSPVKAVELDSVDLEISVLSKPKQITDVDQIQLGVHGVIVSRGFLNHGVFLPQVATETGWTKEEFLSQLCSQKAGLPFDAWKDPETKLEIFTADVFSEKATR